MFHGSCRHRDHRHGRRSRAIAYRTSRALQQIGLPCAAALPFYPTGSFEAAAISRGIDSGRAERPIAHDLLLDTLDALDAKLERIEIVRAEPPVFYATVVVLADSNEHRIDARPSDAIALAVRSNAPMFVEDDIMNRLGTVSPVAEEVDDEQELRSSTSSSIRSRPMILNDE